MTLFTVQKVCSAERDGNVIVLNWQKSVQMVAVVACFRVEFWNSRNAPRKLRKFRGSWLATQDWNGLSPERASRYSSAIRIRTISHSDM